MDNSINVYCDESCHLENDTSKFMVIGGIYVKKSDVSLINEEIKQIKIKHGFTHNYEIKWTKIRKNNIDLSIELIEYFFLNQKMRFRGYIINKQGLNHKSHFQTHNQWYYKMFYRLLEPIIEQGYLTSIYLDIKDTVSSLNIQKLKEILNNHAVSFGLPGVVRIQNVQSNETQILQITDIIIGALRYENENINSSESKLKLIELIKFKSKFSLHRSSMRSELKFNLFFWNMGIKGIEQKW